MRVIPVIDVMGGQAVRAVGGRRDEYRPLRSRLTDSTDPFRVARALLDLTGSDEVYFADLDRITTGDSLAAWQLLDDLGAGVTLDRGGLAYRGEYGPGSWGRVRLAIGSEMHDDPAGLRESFHDYRLRRPPVFSIDLWNGEIRGLRDEWGLDDGRRVLDYARQVYAIGFRSFIVLDLAAVGTGRGCPTLDVCASMRSEFPGVELITGGGVRGWDDVRRLEDAGADGVLVASALHDGALTFPRPVL